MNHLPTLIQDLGFILITAGIVTLLFRKLKQPVVLGYLIAGFLVGPYVPQIPTVSDENSIKIWAEIGVIFLLFSLGLEFSFKKLAQVGKAASITAVSEIIFMLFAGYLTGIAVGWSKMDSMFLGGILSISSTTIIVRAFDELGLKGKRFVNLVFGILIVEDLIAILLLVLLSTVAVTQKLSGVDLLSTSLKLAFFLILWFLVGIYLIPIFLKKTRSLLTDETMLLVAIGLCLLMVIIATEVGFSPALGAFVMGSILAETIQAKRIEHLLTPVRDLFAAVFFVSVGMLINPEILRQYFWLIMLITFVTIFGKLLSTSLGAIISGQNLKNSVQTGMSLAQIGEFSFIIATLGMSLKVTSDFLYPIAVAVSAITTFSTPYQIKYSERFYEFLEKNLPKKFLEKISSYHVGSAQISQAKAFNILWEMYGMKIATSTTLVVAIVIGVEKFILPFLYPTIATLIAFLVSFPFLVTIAFGKPSTMNLNSSEYLQIKLPHAMFTVFRLLLVLGLLIFLASQFTPYKIAYGIMIVPLIVALLFFRKTGEPIYTSLENRFLSNLKEKEVEQVSESKNIPELAPWDAILSELTVSPDSELVGRSLQEAKIKERFGVTVALIQRGSKRILAPNKNDLLLPFDLLYIIGTDSQLDRIRDIIERKIEDQLHSEDTQYGLMPIIMKENSPFAGKTIRSCGIRESIHGLIVGIERNGERILNPDSSTILAPNDLIWVVGNRDLIKSFFT